jgi:hypothetical protein
MQQDHAFDMKVHDRTYHNKKGRLAAWRHAKQGGLSCSGVPSTTSASSSRRENLYFFAETILF